MEDMNLTPTSAVNETPKTAATGSISAALAEFSALNQANNRAVEVKQVGAKPVVPKVSTVEDTVAEEDQEIAETETTDGVDESTTVESSEDQGSTGASQTEDDTPEFDENETLDFLAFANLKPGAKFTFMRNGKEMVKTAKELAGILGQGSAIHEDARLLKVEKAAFEEESSLIRNRQNDLMIAMEFTVEPRVKELAENINSNRGKLNHLRELKIRHKNDVEVMYDLERAEPLFIEQINKDHEAITDLRKQSEKFRQIKREQVSETLTRNRQNFKDTELKNKYNFEQLREQLVKEWPNALVENVPGVPNIDLVMADETILTLVRDGRKFRKKVPTKSAGASVAQVLKKAGASSTSKPTSNAQSLDALRERARKGDKVASGKLAAMYLQSLGGQKK